MDGYWETGYGLSNDTKMSHPNFTPSPSFGVNNGIKYEINWILHFQLIKHCGKVVPINNFQRQSNSSKCLESNRE